MERDRDAARTTEGTDDDDTIREGSLVIEEKMNRREGLVEYEGTVGGTGGDATATTGAAGTDTWPEQSAGSSLGGAAMQAGATVLGGLTPSTTDTSPPMSDTAGTGAGTGGTSGISMSTDNTASGSIAADTAASGPIAQVRDKMKVVSAGGEDLGKVEYVKLGDPQAATTAGQAATTGGGTGATGGAVATGGGTLASGGGIFAAGGGALTDTADAVFGSDDEPRVEEPMRSQLLRTGFIKIDGKGWFGSDRYVPADQIASVSGDTVTLSVTKDQMLEAP